MIRVGTLFFSIGTSWIMCSRTGMMADNVTCVPEASASVNLLRWFKELAFLIDDIDVDITTSNGMFLFL